MRTVAMGLWRIRGSRPAPRRFPAAVPYRRGGRVGVSQWEGRPYPALPRV